MKKLWILIIVFASQTAFAQIVFTVDNFSPDYYGKITVHDTNDVFMKGSIAIFDKKTGKEVIKVVSDEFAFDHPNGQVRVNIKELPYGEQSVIMYDDFNFDGIKDFAIEDGQKSAYHLPSFNIYLAEKKGFAISTAFSRLAHENTGMFEVDPVEKKIHTMTKSGCCWHQFSEYIVEKNAPKAIRIIDDDQTNSPYETMTEQKWNGRKMVSSIEKILNLEDVKPLFSFKITEKAKGVLLFIYNGMLNYAYVDTTGKVDFSYPVETDEETPGFTLDTTKNQLSLTFANKSANYRVYEQSGKVGVDAVTKGILFEQVGEPNSKNGSLRELINMKLENLIIR